MQRKNNANQRKYTQSGLPGHNAPGGKKASNTRQLVQLIIIIGIVLMVLILVVYGIFSALGNSNKPVRLNVSVTDNIQPFGENILSYDGMTLTCFRPNGNTHWRFTLGSGADYYATSAMIVAWAGDQLYVLDKGGVVTFNDRMDGPIRFARIGDAYVAACIGTEKESFVAVMDHTGTPLETAISFDSLYVMDIGFFYSKGQLMWVLALDIDGNAPITNISTYEPGRMITGRAELNEELVYRVYLHNNMLMLVDTTRIQAYNYKCVEQTDINSLLVYGWEVKEVRTIGKNTYALLEQMPTAGDDATFSELRLITNYTRKSLRLLSPCHASGLSEKGVYGFGSNVIYYAPYGATTFKPFYLAYTLTDFICMLSGGRAVLVSGEDVFVMKLPA